MRRISEDCGPSNGRPQILQDLEAAGFDLDAVAYAIANHTSWHTQAQRLLHSAYGLDSGDIQFIQTVLQRGRISSRELEFLEDITRRAW